jgi:hypothetical protein
VDRWIAIDIPSSRSHRVPRPAGSAPRPVAVTGLTAAAGCAAAARDISLESDAETTTAQPHGPTAPRPGPLDRSLGPEIPCARRPAAGAHHHVAIGSATHARRAKDAGRTR